MSSTLTALTFVLVRELLLQINQQLSTFLSFFLSM